MQQEHWQQVGPEAAGIPSEAVARLIDCLEAKRLPMHGLVLLRRGRLAAEAYWKPFHRDFMHRMYSSSKSFVSVAIGLMEGEGLISLDDRVIDYFPEYDNQDTHPAVAMTTIRDLLSMRTAFATGSYAAYADWTEAFFRMEANHFPGMTFRYDTSASVMLGMLVRRVTGEEFLAYLRPRLFEPAGMREDIWSLQTPCGHDWAGSGVICTARDLARFGQVCLQAGRYQDRQLIPEAYMRLATGKVSDNETASPWPETQFGYGYQFWRTRHGFACCGMGSQLALCVPEKDLVLAVTADTQACAGGNGEVMSALWAMLPALSDAPLPENPQAQAALARRMDSLALQPVCGAASSPTAGRVHGRTYSFDGVFADNPMGLRRACFTFGEGEGAWTYENKTGRHTLRFGLGGFVRQPFPETHYHGKTMQQPLGRGYDSLASAAWVDEETLRLCCYATDWYMGTLKMNFVFQADRITIHGMKFAEMFFEAYEGYAAGVMPPGP